MKTSFFRSPYITTALIFLVVLFVGRLIWGWGALTFAFFLLVYCLIAIGIRIDELIDRLGDMQTTLGQIRDALERPLDDNPS